jgi:hypothetical protein
VLGEVRETTAVTIMYAANVVRQIAYDERQVAIDMKNDLKPVI